MNSGTTNPSIMRWPSVVAMVCIICVSSVNAEERATDRIEFMSSKFYYTFGPHEPTLTIDPGTRLRVICPDSDNELADGTLLTPEQRHQEPDTTLFEGNPVAGPIFVNGAEPGDAIAVRIEAVGLDRAKGQTLIAPAHGLLPIGLLTRPDQEGQYGKVPRHMFFWNIDPEAGVATLVNPLGDDKIMVKLDPFVGAVGVAPKWGQSISTLLNGDYGGNMDIPDVKPGATIFLPVNRDGGLVMMGDLHAAQGQGEIIGGAIETSGKVDCTIDLIKGKTLRAPRLRDDQQIMAMGTAGDLHGAVVEAYANLLDWLVEDYGLNRWDAYNLMSQTGRIALGNFGFAPFTVAAGMPIDALPDNRRQEK